MPVFASRNLPDVPQSELRLSSAAPRDHHDRRSPFRPLFREGWRKRLPQSEGGNLLRADDTVTAPIYVWASKVNTLLAAATNLSLLDDGDRALLQTLRDGRSKNSAIAARILLRLSLSAMTERRVAPQSWRFSRSNSGKPFIKDNREGLHFSVSHVDAIVMVALSRGIGVGIDVETVDQEFEERLIDHFCHTSERQILDALPAAQRRRTFLELWTEKEAYTKMLGLGHALDFQSVCVRSLQRAEDDAAQVCVEDFYFSVDHSLHHAALAIDRGPDRRPIEIVLMSAALPNEAAFTVSPASL